MSIRAFVTHQILKELSYKTITVFSSVTSDLPNDTLTGIVNAKINELSIAPAKTDDSIGILIGQVTQQVRDYVTDTVAQDEAYAIVRKDNDYINSILNDISGKLASKIQMLLTAIRVTIRDKVDAIAAEVRAKSSTLLTQHNPYSFGEVEIFNWAGLSDNYIREKVITFFNESIRIFIDGKVNYSDKNSILDRLTSTITPALSAAPITDIETVKMTLRDAITASDLNVKIENCNDAISLIINTSKLNDFAITVKNSMGDDYQEYKYIPELIRRATDYFICVENLVDKFSTYEDDLGSNAKSVYAKLLALKNLCLMTLGLGYVFKEKLWRDAIILPKNYASEVVTIPLINADNYPTDGNLEDYNVELSKYATYLRQGQTSIASQASMLLVRMETYKKNKENYIAALDQKQSEDKNSLDISNREALVSATKVILNTHITDEYVSFGPNLQAVKPRHDRGLVRVEAILGRKEVTLEDAITQYYLILFDNPVLTRFYEVFNTYIRTNLESYDDLTALRNYGFCEAILDVLVNYFKTRTLVS
jgi:hypothetical protein